MRDKTRTGSKCRNRSGKPDLNGLTLSRIHGGKTDDKKETTAATATGVIGGMIQLKKNESVRVAVQGVTRHGRSMTLPIPVGARALRVDG